MLTWADGGALLAVTVWGISFPIIKVLMGRMDPLALAFLRGLVSSVVLVAVLVRGRGWRWPPRADWPQLVTIALLGHTLNQVLYAWGLRLTTASHSGLIFTLTPLFVFGVSHALGHVRIGRLDVAGLALGLVGALLILGAPRGGSVDGGSLVGDLLTVGAAITWGLWTIFAAPLLARHGTRLVTAWITATGTLGLLPLALPGLVAQDWHQPWWMYGGILYTATVSGALGALLWYSAVRHLGAARTAIYANMESFVAVVASAVMLGERVAGTSIVGGAAVVAGVLLTRRRG